MRRFVKWVIYLIILLIVLIVIGGVVFTALFNENNVKSLISERFTVMTGRHLKIKGKISLSYFPWIGFKVKEATISNLPGFGNKPFATIGEIDIKIKFIPLFSAKLVADKVLLKGVKVHLIRNDMGAINWDLWNKSSTSKQQHYRHPMILAANETQSVTVYDDDSPLAYGAKKKPKKGKWGINISTVQVSDSAVELDDQKTNQKTTFYQIHFLGKHISFDKPFLFTLSGLVRCANPNITGSFNIRGDLLIDSGLKNINLNNLIFQSQLRGDKLPNKELNIFLKTSILTNLNAQQIDIKKLNLQASSLVLKDVMGMFRYTQIEKMTQKKLFGIKGRINVPLFQLSKLKLTNMAMLVEANDNIFNIPSVNADLYQGQLTGSLRYDRSVSPNTITFKETLTNVQAGPLLFFAGLELGVFNNQKSQGLFDHAWTNIATRVTGKASLNSEITTQGQSNLEWRKNLNGHLEFTFKDGAIKGINLSHFIKLGEALVHGKTPPTGADNLRTAFTHARAHFIVREGIASSDDIILQSPLLKITSKGEANLVTSTLNFDIKATPMKLNAQNNQKQSQLSDIVVPLQLCGTFYKPSLRIDPTALLELKAEDKLKSLKHKIDKQIKKHFGNDVGENIQKRLQKPLKSLEKLFN